MTLATSDTYISALAPNTNYGNDIYLVVASAANPTRVLLKFEIPTGRPSSAKLRLSFETTDAVGSTYEVLQLTRTDWSGIQATWNDYKTGSPWTTPGGDFVMAAAVAVVPPVDLFMEWDILDIARDAFTAGIDIHLLVKNATEAGAGVYTDFWSNQSAGGDALKPTLTLEYGSPQTIQSRRHILEPV